MSFHESVLDLLGGNFLLFYLPFYYNLVLCLLRLPFISLNATMMFTHIQQIKYWPLCSCSSPVQPGTTARSVGLFCLFCLAVCKALLQNTSQQSPRYSLYFSLYRMSFSRNKFQLRPTSTNFSLAFLIQHQTATLCILSWELRSLIFQTSV